MENLDTCLDQVRRLMAEVLSETVLGRLADHSRALTGSGKMLRARLLLRIAEVRKTPRPAWLSAAAAVEMIHAASLLHDDVIDGGIIRRHLPAFWKQRGIAGAILAGDLMLFKALDLLVRAEETRLLAELIRHTGTLCDAEAEQELLSRGGRTAWAQILDVNRRKTGSLFAFAASAAAGGDKSLHRALLKAGYALGTAYQLADDILDASGAETAAGKTLGTDRARRKNTAANPAPPKAAAPARHCRELRRAALAAVRRWPEIHATLQDYCRQDFDPVVEPMLAGRTNKQKHRNGGPP